MHGYGLAWARQQASSRRIVVIASLPLLAIRVKTQTFQGAIRYTDQALFANLGESSSIVICLRVQPIDLC